MARKSKVPSFRSMGQQDKNAVIYTVLTRPYVREYRAFRVALAGQGVVGALDLSAPQAARPPPSRARRDSCAPRACGSRGVMISKRAPRCA